MPSSSSNHIKAKRVAIVYSVYMPINGRAREAEAERAVAEAAQQAAAAMQQGGLARPMLLPIRDSLSSICANLNRLRPDVLVNLCEGFRGRPEFEAHQAGLWELLKIPFTGNSASALQLCRDKFQTKLLMRAAGINVPLGWLANDAADVPHTAGWPLIVKPMSEDGGIGIYRHSVVHTQADLAVQIKRIVNRYARPALVEQYIDGREFNVAIIERRGLEVLPISEILFGDLSDGMPRLVGYQAKWQPRHEYYRKTTPQCPAQLPERAAEVLRTAALRAWAAAGLRGYARFDFRMDRRGRIYLLEINPNPDTSLDAGLARALDAAGIKYSDFWVSQVQMACRRKRGAAC